MAASAALALDRALQPSMSTILLRAVIVAALCGAAGLVHRKAWAVSLILLPVGLYLLLRTTAPPPVDVRGIGGLYTFYIEQLGTGAGQYAAKFFPLGLTGAPELRLLLAFTVYCLTGAAAFVALSLRRPVPAVGLVLLLLGFGFTVDAVPRMAWFGRPLSRALRPSARSGPQPGAAHLATARRRSREWRSEWSARYWRSCCLGRRRRRRPPPGKTGGPGTRSTKAEPSTPSTGCRTTHSSSIRRTTWSS